MSLKLYVGGLSPATDDQRLLAAFSDYGDITEAVVILKGDSGVSRGFGFVSFADDAAGERAIGGRNGSELDGNTITVNVARPRPTRDERGLSR